MAQSPKDLQRVAIYLRKSRADLEAEARGEGETLSKHRRELFEFARRQNFAIADIYEELVSGERILDRPEVQKLLHGVSEGRYRAVLCMDVDRIGRGNKIDQGLIQEAFQGSKTLIITPRKTYDLQDETDEEFLDFESFLAHRELKIISRRMQRGRRQSVSAGKSISSRPPFGYRREAKKLVPDPETAPWVQRMYEWAAAGWGRMRIARELNDMGIPSPRGGTWEHSTVHHILTNPAYIGHLRWDYFRRRKADGHLKKTKQPLEVQTWARNAHEPIVSEELFQCVQGTQRHAPVGVKKPLANPFAGLIRCAECGKPLQRIVHPPKSPRLQCKTYRCPTRSARLQDVEQAVLAALQDRIPSVHSEADRSKDHAQRLQSALLALSSAQKSLTLAESQRARLHDLLEQGAYDIDTFVERSRLLSTRIEELRMRRAALQADAERLQHTPAVSAEAVQAVLDSYAQTPTAEKKNKLLREVVESIVYRRDRGGPEPTPLSVEIFLRI